ncbi:MAG: hypothetical protein MI785_09020 [Kiloniellales bacterium]|nr:hypothetical protein [Kiloniellales bacterium]
MRKLFMAGVASFALSLSATSVMSADTQLTGFVTPVCEVEIADLLLDWGVDPVSGDKVAADVDVQCNDIDGATIALRSAEGGLESDDFEDYNVNYKAKLFEASTGIDLTLLTVGGAGPNDQTAEQVVSGGVELRDGQIAELTVVLKGTPTWAGGYSDTLSVEITAN